MSSSTELFIYFIYYLEMIEKSTNKPYIVAIVFNVLTFPKVSAFYSNNTVIAGRFCPY